MGRQGLDWPRGLLNISSLFSRSVDHAAFSINIFQTLACCQDKTQTAIAGTATLRLDHFKKIANFYYDIGAA